MELRTLHLDGQTLRTRVYATHPDRVVDVELSADVTARLLTAAAPFLNWLATADYLPQGASRSRGQKARSARTFAQLALGVPVSPRR